MAPLNKIERSVSMKKSVGTEYMTCLTDTAVSSRSLGNVYEMLFMNC